MGIIQGLTEFLPVSSSGHLELLNHFLGDTSYAFSTFDIILLAHLGTALSITYIFRNEILQMILSTVKWKADENRQLSFYIIISMIPAMIIGLLFEQQIEDLFGGSLMPIGFSLLFTALVLALTPSGVENFKTVGYTAAFVIGMAQMIAIMPGVSRSGMTLATALFIGIMRKDAAKFSFLMVLPVIFGKVILDFISGDFNFSSSSLLVYFIAIASSFVVGVIACKWMIKLVENSRLRYFAIYCFIVGIFAVVASYNG